MDHEIVLAWLACSREMFAELIEQEHFGLSDNGFKWFTHQEIKQK